MPSVSDFYNIARNAPAHATILVERSNVQDSERIVLAKSSLKGQAFALLGKSAFISRHFSRIANYKEQQSLQKEKACQAFREAIKKEYGDSSKPIKLLTELDNIKTLTVKHLLQFEQITNTITINKLQNQPHSEVSQSLWSPVLKKNISIPREEIDQEGYLLARQAFIDTDGELIQQKLTGSNPNEIKKFRDQKENAFRDHVKDHPELYPATNAAKTAIAEESNNTVPQGKLEPLTLDFNLLSAKKQAEAILDRANTALNANTNLPGVAISYSANLEQTQTIKQSYQNGQWKTATSGSNQAEVMKKMEQLLESKKYRHLQGKVHIAPITTMAYQGRQKVAVSNEVVRADLDNIQENYLDKGWLLLGWQNQKTTGTDAPYAIGRGVFKAFPQQQKEMIQQQFKAWKANY